MKVPPSVQEVMVCWGLTQRESDKIKMSLHSLKFSIKIKMSLHQLKCTMYHLSDQLRLAQQCSDFFTKNTLIEMSVTN